MNKLQLFDDEFLDIVRQVINHDTFNRYVIAACLPKYYPKSLYASFSELKYDTKTQDLFLDGENINYIKYYL